MWVSTILLTSIMLLAVVLLIMHSLGRLSIRDYWDPRYQLPFVWEGEFGLFLFVAAHFVFFGAYCLTPMLVIVQATLLGHMWSYLTVREKLIHVAPLCVAIIFCPAMLILSSDMTYWLSD